MAIKRILIILLISYNTFFCAIRDPFKPVNKVNKKEISLNAILSNESQKFASVSYNDKNYIVSQNEKIEQKYLVQEIGNNDLKLIDSETQEEKVILLPS